MKVKIKKLHENAVIPSYAHHGDACFDLTACTVNNLYQLSTPICGGESVVCGTGLSFKVPAGHVMLVYSRSGMGFLHGIRLANCVGVVDAGYLGEVMVKLTCDEQYDDLPCPVIKPGDRIAQAMVIQVEACEFELVDELNDSARGTSGFGESGK